MDSRTRIGTYGRYTFREFYNPHTRQMQTETLVDGKRKRKAKKLPVLEQLEAGKKITPINYADLDRWYVEHAHKYRY